MSSLIAICVHSTEANDRFKYTKECLESLRETVDFDKHRLCVINNASSAETKEYLSNFINKNWHFKGENICIAHLSENIGTARGINFAMLQRKAGETVIKCDDDVVVHQSCWVDEMEEVIVRDPTIGIVGLKRKDINFDPNNTDISHRSKLIGLPHVAGQRWINVEGGGSIMGTCTMYNHLLVDKIGGLKQPGLYGFDDSLYCLRAELAGFWNCYLPHIVIDHIDDGSNSHTQDKHAQAGSVWNEYGKWHNEYVNGTRPLWEDFV